MNTKRASDFRLGFAHGANAGVALAAVECGVTSIVGPLTSNFVHETISILQMVLPFVAYPLFLGLLVGVAAAARRRSRNAALVRDREFRRARRRREHGLSPFILRGVGRIRRTDLVRYADAGIRGTQRLLSRPSVRIQDRLHAGRCRLPPNHVRPRGGSAETPRPGPFLRSLRSPPFRGTSGASRDPSAIRRGRPPPEAARVADDGGSRRTAVCLEARHRHPCSTAALYSRAHSRRQDHRPANRRRDRRAWNILGRGLLPGFRARGSGGTAFQPAGTGS